MKITIDNDERIIKKAMTLAGEKDVNILIVKSLEYLVALESAKKLSKLGGTERNIQNVKRRR
jgi:hypothetical protein